MHEGQKGEASPARATHSSPDHSPHPANAEFRQAGLQAAGDRQFLKQEIDFDWLLPLSLTGSADSSTPAQDSSLDSYQGQDPPSGNGHRQSESGGTVACTPPPAQKTYSSPSSSSQQRARLRWTPELHAKFVQAVRQLKNANKATPKGILKLMNVEGLTIFHIKSHLQKYRTNLRSNASSEFGMDVESDMEEPPKRKSARVRRKKLSLEEMDLEEDQLDLPSLRSDDHLQNSIDVDLQALEFSTPSFEDLPDMPPNCPPVATKLNWERQEKLKQALIVQMEMQKHLHHQLETQRQLQVSLEAHGRYISSLIEPETQAIGPTEDKLINDLPSLESDLDEFIPGINDSQAFDAQWAPGQEPVTSTPLPSHLGHEGKEGAVQPPMPVIPFGSLTELPSLENLPSLMTGSRHGSGGHTYGVPNLPSGPPMSWPPNSDFPHLAESNSAGREPQETMYNGTWEGATNLHQQTSNSDPWHDDTTPAGSLLADQNPAWQGQLQWASLTPWLSEQKASVETTSATTSSLTFANPQSMNTESRPRQGVPPSSLLPMYSMPAALPFSEKFPPRFPQASIWQPSEGLRSEERSVPAESNQPSSAQIDSRDAARQSADEGQILQAQLPWIVTMPAQDKAERYEML